MIDWQVKRKLENICKDHTITDYSVIINEPYIPYIPSNWNKILILAESQNLAGSQVAEYRKKLENETASQRIRRLYWHDGTLGIGPWDNDILKFAFASAFGNNEVEKAAVSNFVLWSIGDIDKKNHNPDKFTIESSVDIWKDMLPILKPEIIITAGTIAKSISKSIQGQDIKILNWRSASRLHFISNIFSANDLLSRYPEVKKAMSINSYSPGKIMYACHAVSKTIEILSASNLGTQESPT